MANPQALLALHTEQLCNSVRHLAVLPDILLWQKADYETLVNLDKFEVMANLEHLSDLFSEKIWALKSKVETIEHILGELGDPTLDTDNSLK
ncbi:hypothetical protein GVX76_00750 [[Haemophilus] felis]|nr:hypothetical protein [[Haemophilus] felis]